MAQQSVEQNVSVIFKRLESIAVRGKLQRLGVLAGQEITAQGYLWDQPRASFT